MRRMINMKKLNLPKHILSSYNQKNRTLVRNNGFVQNSIFYTIFLLTINSN